MPRALALDSKTSTATTFSRSVGLILTRFGVLSACPLFSMINLSLSSSFVGLVMFVIRVRFLDSLPTKRMPWALFLVRALIGF